MKHILLIIALMNTTATILAQSPAPLTPSSKKMPIDTSAIKAWPTLGPVCMSGDGNFTAYAINNQPIGKSTLVIQSTVDLKKQEFILSQPYAREYFFTDDAKKTIFINGDTAYFFHLETKQIDYLSNISSYRRPSNYNGQLITFLLKDTNKTLILLNLSTGKRLSFRNVTDYLFSDIGNVLLLKTTTEKNNIDRTELLLVSPTDGSTDTVWYSLTNQKVDGYAFDQKGSQLTFMVREGNQTADSNSIWYYKRGMKKAELKLNNLSPLIVDSSLFISGPAQFSENGKWLFFRLQSVEKVGTPSPYAARVNIWSYKDKVLYPQQRRNPTLRERIGVVTATNSNYIYISSEDEQLETVDLRQITSDYIVIRNNNNTPQWWPLLSTPYYWLVDLNSGSKTLLKKEGKCPVWYFSFSPGGNWLIYWDSEKSSYISYNIKTGKSANINRLIPLISREKDYVFGFVNSIYPQPVSELAGWYSNDEWMFIYDQYDVWKVDPAGIHPPENVTNGYGVRNKIKLRLIYDRDKTGRPIIYTGEESILLTGFNTLNKQNGFLIKHLKNKGDPILLSMGPYTYYLVESQKAQSDSFSDGMQPVVGGDVSDQKWIIQRSSASESPNYFLSKDFKNYQALTDLQPQKNYNWLKAELHSWKQLDGTISQGILYKPEDFDLHKTYPVIFNYYEMLSHRLYGFPSPKLTDGNIDISWFVSRGYLVFTPDIHFSTASSKDGKLPGEAALNSIESAALYLSTLPYVNKKKLAIQGHSFGGGLTNYVITRSKLFAAACSVAGTVSDQISAYLGMVQVNGESLREYRLDHSETGHDRIGTTLWQRPDLYIKASPVFKANQVTTPLLLMHNQGDDACDWRQSAELYLALRRLGKKVWMLQYDDEAHTLVDRRNAIDFTIRVTQFFDYYLKDAKAPIWMTEGVPAYLKGIEAGYELDKRQYIKP